jgi:hypothetical protein
LVVFLLSFGAFFMPLLAYWLLPLFSNALVFLLTGLGNILIFGQKGIGSTNGWHLYFLCTPFLSVYGAENPQNLSENQAILQFLQIYTDLSLPRSP